MTLPMLPMLRRAIALVALLAVPSALQAQTEAAGPSFSLSSYQTFTTRDHPAIELTFRQVDHLDFRVYRVNDPFAFFEKLRDPHALGSDEPIVPQEQTWLERIAAWKASRRADVRTFIRLQLSRRYRTERLAQDDAKQVVQRQTLNVRSFAQVPLLNASQLVTSWREILPRVRDAEARRLPLDVPGAGIYVVEAVNPPLRAYTVVIISDLGLVTKSAPGQLVVYAANRLTGQPSPACQVRVLVDQKPAGSGTTAADGTFETPLPAGRPDNLVTVARCGTEIAATDPGAFSVGQSPRELVAYTYTDKPIYRPGHTVRFKSILRWREGGALKPLEHQPVEVSVADAQDKVLFRQRLTPDEFGSIHGEYVVPTTAPLGYYTVRVASGDHTASASFEVQEYRKPEFDVAVRPATTFALQGTTINAVVTARYYFGQAVAGASVKYVVHRQPYYSALRFDDGGEGEGDEGDNGGGGYDGGDETIEGQARLDGNGTATLAIPLAVDPHGHDYTARIEARVTDASGREVAGAAPVNATYGRFMVIARGERFVYSPGQRAAFTLRTVGYDGNPVPQTPLHAVLEEVVYDQRGGAPTITTVSESSAQTDADGRARTEFVVPPKAGSYRVRVSAASDGRTVSDFAYVWVPGHIAGFTDDGDQFLELVADRKTYQPGDTAKLIVRGAEFDTSVLVTKEHQRVSYHQVLHARANEAFDVPITDDDVGDVYVSLAFLKDDRLYRAERRLTVPATKQRLTITATTDRPVARPGQPGVFALHVADAGGQPVHAQLSVGLVDEAVYGVRPDNTPDPLRAFYRREYNVVSTELSRNYVFVGHSGTEQLLLARHRRRPMTLADFKADRPDRPRVRKDFPDTIFWAADVTTDTAGNASVRVDYPDSLTTWRLTVRGVTAATAVGVARAHAMTTKDLILRVVTPRFLTEGDEVSIPTVVHNYLPDAKSVTLSFAADGLTRLDADAGSRTLQIASNGQQRSDWRFKADKVRTVSVTGTALTDTESDAVKLTLPVLPAGLPRTSGSSGSIVGGGERTAAFSVPANASPSARTVSVSLAPSLAGTLLGALDYLSTYPYGCTEQTLSSFVPNLVVMHALDQMKLAPTERLAALNRQVADGLARLYDYQHPDGGWGWWKTDRNHPFMTAYALDGLMQARASGANVETWRIGSAARALAGLYARYPRALPDLKSYMVYVLARAAAGKEETDEAFKLGAAIDDLWSARERMTPSGRAFLLMTLDQQKDARGDAAAKELVGLAQTKGELTWWADDRDSLLDDFGDTSAEATALAVKALAPREAKGPMLESAVRWLVLNRSAGGFWMSTKQTAMAISGLLDYMRARGEQAAPVAADIFVNGAKAGSHTFDRASLTSPNPVVVTAEAREGANDVRITATGAGALYYSASLRYYDKPAASERTGSRHLALTRTYARLAPVEQNGRFVYRELPFDGTAKVGDLLLVRLTAAGSTDWRYLMLEDPFPAGAEAVEKEELYELERRQPFRFGINRELRDDRAVFFLEDFAAGRYEFSYLLKVTTPGVFGAMPARIAPMYVPDTSASSDTKTLTVSAEGVR